MAKKFHHETTSDVDVEAVFEVLSGDDWAAQLATHLRDDSQTVRRDVGSDGSVTLVLSRRLPPGIPPFLQKFLPSDPRVVTTDVWGPAQDGVRHCSWTAEITGTPAKIVASIALRPAVVPGILMKKFGRPARACNRAASLVVVAASLARSGETSSETNPSTPFVRR